jgi:lipoate-protein ligase A
MTSRRVLTLLRDSFPERPAFDTALSRALLIRVAAGELRETLRVARPGAMVAFGRQDVTSSGYAEAVTAARNAGFEAVERLAGGRAAVFHEGTIGLAWAIADADPLTATHGRFAEAASIVATALEGLGFDARVGEVPGEYCPGAYSVSLAGRTKVMGIGQRVVRGGAHLGGVLVVSGGDRIREVLVPVYDALGLDWDSSTAGSLADELAPLPFERVEEALLGSFGQSYDLEEASFDPETLDLAGALAPQHLSPDFEALPPDQRSLA